MSGIQTVFFLFLPFVVGDGTGAYSRVGEHSTSYTHWTRPVSLLLTAQQVPRYTKLPMWLTACSIAKVEPGAFITPILQAKRLRFPELK